MEWLNAEWESHACPECGGKGSCPFCSSTGKVYKRKDTGQTLQWYKAFFCKEQDYSIQPLNTVSFDLLVENVSQLSTEIARLEAEGWGANTHYQFVGYLSDNDAHRLMEKGVIQTEGRVR